MKGKILSYTNEWVKIYRIWGVGSNAAMIKLQLYALVAVGIRVTLGQDWHINYWDLFSSFLQLLFIQGEICNSGSTGPHHIKNSLHRWDAWGCIQLKLATYRLSCEIFWEGCRQKKRWKGLKGREESGEGQSLESSVRSARVHVAVWRRWHRHCLKVLFCPLSCIRKSSSNLKLLRWYYLPSSFE